jgi:hypothetical protein
MADSKISALPASTTPLAGTEVLPIVQSSTTVKVSVDNLTAGRFFSALGMTLTSSATGAGITFPATESASSNANTLDDYEEGTWTPALTFGGGSTGLTYNQRFGWYTKIGNQIYIQCLIFLSSIGSSTGDVVISGLPFASAPDSYKRNGGYGFFDRCTPAAILGIDNTTTFQLNTISSGPASSAASLTESNMANNAYISASFIYLI